MFSTLTLGLIALLTSQTNAFWRMGCPGRLVQERADPLITPGLIAPHVHHIAGGNAFGFTADYDDLRESTCSSCPITQDLSVYWTPKLYYHAQNGSFISVPVAGDGNGLAGGMAVYYLQRPGTLPNGTVEKLHAFPEGFRMLAGNAFTRNYTGTTAAAAISFVCLNYNGAEPVPQGPALPTVNCPDGVRAQVFFPSCWDGVNLDSADHTSHMSYPNSSFPDNGACPSSHPVHTISLFYEVIYQTNLFSTDWYGSGQPFVFAQGDPTGYGFHGDFINGWDVNVLQEATDNCNDASGDMTLCPYFDFFTAEQSQACQIAPEVDEDILGPLPALPGCNPVQNGPGVATNYFSTCTDIGSIATPQYYTDVTKSLGWSYVGCGNDSASARTFTGLFLSNTTQSVESCIASCSAHGFNYAGMEYGVECYCGNTLPSSRAPVANIIGSCSMPCAGNNGEICGGYAALSIYTKCGGSSCVNIPYVPLGDETVLKQSSPSSTASAANVQTSSTTMLTSTRATSSSSSTTATASVSTFTPTCPASNGLRYTTTNGDTFTLECFEDRRGGDLSTARTPSYAACLTACSTTSGCVGLSYVPASPNGFCYMKENVTAQVSSVNTWGATLGTTGSHVKNIKARGPARHRRAGHERNHETS